MIYLILPLNRKNPKITASQNYGITVGMLHTTTKWLEICIDSNIDLNQVEYYTWTFTSRIFRLALELTFSLNKYFFLQMAYDLLSQSRKISGGTLIRDREYATLPSSIRTLRFFFLSCVVSIGRYGTYILCVGSN